MKDTSPEINEMIFQRMMSLSGAERVRMGSDLTATAMAIVWSTIPVDLSESTRKRMFLERFYGQEFAQSMEGMFRPR